MNKRKEKYRKRKLEQTKKSLTLKFVDTKILFPKQKKL